MHQNSINSKGPWNHHVFPSEIAGSDTRMVSVASLSCVLKALQLSWLGTVESDGKLTMRHLITNTVRWICKEPRGLALSPQKEKSKEQAKIKKSAERIKPFFCSSVLVKHWTSLRINTVKRPTLQSMRIFPSNLTAETWERNKNNLAFCPLVSDWTDSRWFWTAVWLTALHWGAHFSTFQPGSTGGCAQRRESV